MTPFATDADLIHWEPHIHTEAASISQALLAGTGTLDGTTFTIDAGSLIDAHITPDHVIVLGAPIDGSFPVIKVENATQLILSPLYDELYPEDEAAEPVPVSPGEGSGIAFSIRTFWPLRKSISDELLQAAGVAPEEAGTILNPQVLRRPCVLGTLLMIYTAMASAAEDPTQLLRRMDLYERLYRRARRGAIVRIDTNGDGAVDLRRRLNVISLRRA